MIKRTGKAGLSLAGKTISFKQACSQSRALTRYQEKYKRRNVSAERDVLERKAPEEEMKEKIEKEELVAKKLKEERMRAVRRHGEEEGRVLRTGEAKNKYEEQLKKNK